MPAQLFANNAFSALASTLASDGVSATLTSGTGSRFPSPTGGDWFVATLVGTDDGGLENAWEIVKVTARSGDVLTIERAKENTTASAWAAGTRIELRLTAGGISGKEPTISDGTAAQYFRGDKTWRDFFTDVRAATLTGLSTATNAVISATDTVLAALGKLQAQISERVTGQASSLDGEVALFSGTGGKEVKRATGSGLAKLTSGVLSTATAGTDYAKPDTASSWTAEQTFKEVKDTVFTITDADGFQIDPANGSIQTVTLGASRTPAATNFESGQAVLLGIADGSAYSITWTTVNPTWVKPGGSASAPTLATTGYTWILLWKVGTTIYAAEVGKP